MERIKALIDQLYQQKQQGCNATQLLQTVQLLHAELSKVQQKAGSFGSSKVAVTLPATWNAAALASATQQVPAVKEESLKSSNNVEFNKTTEPQTLYTPEHKEYSLPKPEIREDVWAEKVPAYAAERPTAHALFESTVEAPTLTQHEPKKEVNELVAEQKESLNDKLKQEKVELVTALKESPIKDLRKGIGINDRFTFINDLFRGDEAMYERSIKTINGFQVFSEAEYWISRELKYKLGWNDSAETVRHFYQLVRRRFS